MQSEDDLVTALSLSRPTVMAAPVPDRAVNSIPDNHIPFTSSADREPPFQQASEDVHQALTDRSAQIRKCRAAAYSVQVAQAETVMKRIPA